MAQHLVSPLANPAVAALVGGVLSFVSTYYFNVRRRAVEAAEDGGRGDLDRRLRTLHANLEELGSMREDVLALLDAGPTSPSDADSPEANAEGPLHWAPWR